MAQQVILYSQPGGASCHQEKEFLSQKGVAFVDRNVREDPAAMAELQKLGYRATPVTVVDGQVVVGFDRGKLERLLGLGGLGAPRAAAHGRGIMRTAHCAGGGQGIEIPGGIASGEIFDCPNGAGLALRASETDGRWSVAAVKRASCAVGDEMVILPDDVRPGDIIVCHGVRQRVTYAYGAYALVRMEGWEGGPACSQASGAQAGRSSRRSAACCPWPSSSSAWGAAPSWLPPGSTAASSFPWACSAWPPGSTCTSGSAGGARGRDAPW